MAARGYDVQGLLGQGDFTFESGLAAARELLGGDDPPTAIIGSNDQMTLAALEVARELGLDVPGQLSLISFDDNPIVRFTDPPLTAINQPIAETFSRAVALLVDPPPADAPFAVPTVVTPTLVERMSTAGAPQVMRARRG